MDAGTLNRKIIGKEDWRKAPGIVNNPKEINSAFAIRDYSIPCKTVLIAIVKGYHIWWCSTHHQPFYKCEKGKAK